MAKPQASLSRILTKLFLLLGVVAIIFPFTYPMGDGRPLLEIGDIDLWPGPERGTIPLGAGGDTGGEPVTIYRWQDSDGTWYFANTAPDGDVAYEALLVEPAHNVIDAPTGTVSHDETGEDPLERLRALGQAMEQGAERRQQMLDAL